jgi:DNA polymerase Pol2
MELQILDCDYIVLNNKPIVRIFGKTKTGETICIFYDKFLPYCYLYGEEEKYPEISQKIKKRFPKVKIDVVEKTLPMGYQKPVKILKITGDNPARTPEIREFARRFGTPYEADILFKYRFMADFGLKGMEWIKVEGSFIKTSTVKCKAFDAKKIEPIEIMKNAPLKSMALDIECLPEEERIPTAEKDAIIVISLAFSEKFKGKDSLVLMTKQARGKDLITCADEKEMLEKMKEIIEQYDPDIICGHNINGFDLPFIIQRMDIWGIQKDIGRSEKSAYARKLQRSYMPSISGRVVVDTFEIYRRDPWVKFKRYDLSTISKALLGVGKVDLEGNYFQKVHEMWNGNGISKFIDYSRRDAELVLRLVIEKRLMDKFFEISKISGVLLQDSLGGQSQRHEVKLLGEFFKRNVLMPCKPSSVDDRLREHGLKGALVLEPEVGFHEWVICLDFTSMYPSLIRAFNICTTTFLRNGEDIEHYETPYNTKFVKQSVFKGVIPSIVDEYLNARVAVKKKQKIETDRENKRILKAKNLALKDLVNSLYGYTGYVRSRLYLMEIANTITALGRDTITKTRKLIEENYPVKVIYADTDSVFIKSDIKDLDEAEKFGSEISAFISKNLYGLDLKFEKVYKTFLIEAKKRYAGWAFERDNGKWVDRIDMKGIETVRRDWCSLVSEVTLETLNTILKEKDMTKASKHVRNIIKDLATGKIPLEKLSITKGITKSLDKYDGIQPHVELAKKIVKRDKTRTVIGERLEYVIIRGNQLLSKRAEDPKWVKEKGLQIDPDYYIHNQLLPPLERVFEVCGITSSELIEGVKQKNLMDILNRKKEESPDKKILKNFESVVCKSCDWTFRRPTLSGKCPKCSGALYFSADGSIGKTVEFKK